MEHPKGRMKVARSLPSAEITFAELLARAAAARSIRPKSLIMTIFGDSIVPRGGTIWLGNIVKLASEFGLAEPFVRTSTLRLANDGWLLRQQVGKLSYYSMAAGYALADAAYQQQIYCAAADLRENGWTIFRMFGDQLDRKDVYRLRNALRRYGFGKLASQVYIHPSIARSATRHIVGTSTAIDTGIVFHGHELGTGADAVRRLADLAWDLDELRKGYQEFIACFEALPAMLAANTPTPGVAFALRTLLVHRFRRLALRDPRLPPECFAETWPGEPAFDLISESYRRLVAPSEAYLDQVFESEGRATRSPRLMMERRFAARV